ncbi:ABC transporter substrate-binding protein [Parasulfuritortus cantonensis]|uniref:ABC transporter substrate-binding protein n=1 Tax=Parasulfuritortus cantonensis TaxID=2528202 RepID=A0A4R1BAA8_9PROT|nr:ABC transporter substrate-binding protein [Parasulfuritortus cantonensis]TCJ13857.1 ABC transporter substrate-binding protein [Parasulfuritortus cantonensis]
MTIRSFGSILAGLLAVTALLPGDSATGFIPLAGAAAPPILIAHVAPTTGRFALHAEADRRGAEMAVEEFNGKGGVLGREIVLVSRDPTLDAKRAAEVAEELISRTHVGFLVGAISSGVAASMSAVAQRHGVLFINTNSSAPTESVENAHRTKFVFDANGANFGRALIRYALSGQAGKRVLLLTEDNVWGHSNATAARQYVAEYGGTVVGEVMAPETLPDPGRTLRQVAAVPADVVVTNISGDNQIKLFAQIDPKVLDRQAWVVGEVDWEELYPAPGTPRPLFGTTWAWNLATPGTAEFVARYRRRYGHTKLDYPGDVTHAAYLATKALLEAIARAGSTNNHAVIEQLEGYRRSARDGMQDDDAYMDPVSHHVQQSIYIARWNPRARRPELGMEILAHVAPDQVRYEPERGTRLEPLSETPHYAP